MAISVLHTTPSNNLTTTIPATSSGSCLIVCIMPFSSGLASSISGVTLGGSADHFAAAVSNGNTSASAFIWADPSCASGQTSVVVSGSNLLVDSANGGIVIYEVAGLAATFAALVDKTTSSTGSSTAYTTGTTAATGNANDLVVGCANVSGAPSSPAGYTNTIPTGGFAIAGQKTVSSTGTFIFNGTATNGPWAGAIAAFNGAAASIFTKNLNVNQAVMRSAVW